MAGLPVRRLAALPQGPDAEAEAHRRSKVAGHAEGGTARVDRFARYRVELCANAARRRARLCQRMTRIGEPRAPPAAIAARTFPRRGAKCGLFAATRASTVES